MAWYLALAGSSAIALVGCAPAKAAMQIVDEPPDPIEILVVAARHLLHDADTLTRVQRPTPRTLLASQPGSVALIVSVPEWTRYQYPADASAVAPDLARRVAAAVSTSRLAVQPAERATRNGPGGRSIGDETRGVDGTLLSECTFPTSRGAQTDCTMHADVGIVLGLAYPRMVETGSGDAFYVPVTVLTRSAGDRGGYTLVVRRSGFGWYVADALYTIIHE